MPVSDEDIARQLFVFIASIRRWFKRRLDDVPYGENPVSEAKFRILHIIAEKQSLTMGDLSRLCHVTKGSLTMTLNKLVKDGYVVRGAEPEDRRIVLVRLTPKGKKYLQHTRQFLVSRISKALAELPEAKKEKLGVLLSDLTEIFQ